MRIRKKPFYITIFYIVHARYITEDAEREMPDTTSRGVSDHWNKR